MPYLGNNLQVAFPSYTSIDDIGGSFNGVLKTFPLKVSGATPVPLPVNPQQCLISVNGVIQKPDSTGVSGFNLVGSNIVFASAPTAGWAFFGVVLAGADYINVGAKFPNGSETSPSVTFDSSLTTGLYVAGVNQLGIAANGVGRMFFSAAGNVGIGTTSPQAILSVSDGTVTGEINPFSASSTCFFGTRTNHSVSFQINASEKVRIDTSGRLLVGTSSSSVNTTLVLNGSSGGAGNPGIVYFQRNEATPAAGVALGQIFFANNAGNAGALITAERDGGTWTSGSSHPGRLVFSTTADGASSPTERMRISSTGAVTCTSTISDVAGDLRSLPQNPKTAAYTLAATDNGKHISITTGGVTVPSAIFSTGQAVTIFNNSGSNQTIVQGASVTLRKAGSGTTGNRTLAQYGVATILCVASNTFVITGTGLT